MANHMFTPVWNRPALHFLFILVSLTNCKQQSKDQSPSQHYAYGYNLTIADTNPMVGTQASFIVKASWYDQSPQAYTMYACSNFQPLKEEKVYEHGQLRRVPLDTAYFVLSRSQADSIYQLAQQTFTIPTQPRLSSSTLPLPPLAHDLDNYLVVRFSPYSIYGPSFVATGYRENNDATYVLQNHLMQLIKQLQKSSAN